MPTAKIVNLAVARKATHFVDPDPVISELIAIMDGSGLSDAVVAARAMCSWQTVRRVRTRTKRPQNYTVDRILMACGYQRLIRRR